MRVWETMVFRRAAIPPVPSGAHKGYIQRTGRDSAIHCASEIFNPGCAEDEKRRRVNGEGLVILNRAGDEVCFDYLTGIPLQEAGRPLSA